MAKIQTLKERGTGEAIYPETAAEAVHFADGRNAQQKADELKGLIDGKADLFSVSEDLKMSDGMVLSVSDEAKRALFIDMWNKACGAHGRYNAETGFFELNGLADIAYDEAIRIYQRSIPFLKQSVPSLMGACHRLTGIRTLMPVRSAECLAVRAFSYAELEVLNLDVAPTNAGYMFWGSAKLRRIMGSISLAMTGLVDHMFEGCAALESVRLLHIRSSLDLADCPRLDLDTFRFMLTNARNGANAIAVTVHPDIYSKLTDEENEEWHALVERAAEKNITFLTN